MNLENDNNNCVTIDGFDEAIIGIIESYNQELRMVYDKEKCIDIITENGITDYDVALEYFEFNILGAYMGPSTPCFFSNVDLNKKMD